LTTILYVPAAKPVKVNGLDPDTKVTPLSFENITGPVPPDAVTVIVPSFAPLQVTFVEVVVKMGLVLNWPSAKSLSCAFSSCDERVSARKLPKQEERPNAFRSMNPSKKLAVGKQPAAVHPGTVVQVSGNLAVYDQGEGVGLLFVVAHALAGLVLQAPTPTPDCSTGLPVASFPTHLKT
jgi:hypothetical protein